MPNANSMKKSLHSIARALYVLVTIVAVLFAVTTMFVGGH